MVKDATASYSDKHQPDLEDFLQRFQRGAMVVVDAIAVGRLTPALGKRREQEHANRAIAEGAAVFGFIPR
jgi:hypothetical protein